MPSKSPNHDINRAGLDQANRIVGQVWQPGGPQSRFSISIKSDVAALVRGEQDNLHRRSQIALSGQIISRLKCSFYPF